jgi:hypothetical protein
VSTCAGRDHRPVSRFVGTLRERGRRSLFIRISYNTAFGIETGYGAFEPKVAKRGIEYVTSPVESFSNHRGHRLCHSRRPVHQRASRIIG